MRAELALSLTQTCTRARTTPTQQTATGGVMPGTPETLDFACRVAPGRVVVKEIGGKLVSLRQVMITAPHGADVIETDALTVAGTDYTIIGLNKWEAQSICLRIEAYRRV